MITIKNADIKLYTERGIEGQICHISFDREDQSFETLKVLGRAKAIKDTILVKQSIRYCGIQLYPDIL